MLKIDLLYERDEDYYYLKEYLGRYYDGVEMLCGQGLAERFNFNPADMPKEMTLVISFEKPKKRRGWFKGVLSSEGRSEIDLTWEKEVCIYRDLITYVQEETYLEEGDEFWFCIEY